MYPQPGILLRLNDIDKNEYWMFEDGEGSDDWDNDLFIVVKGRIIKHLKTGKILHGMPTDSMIKV